MLISAHFAPGPWPNPTHNAPCSGRLGKVTLGGGNKSGLFQVGLFDAARLLHLACHFPAWGCQVWTVGPQTTCTLWQPSPASTCHWPYLPVPLLCMRGTCVLLACRPHATLNHKSPEAHRRPHLQVLNTDYTPRVAAECMNRLAKLRCASG